MVVPDSNPQPTSTVEYGIGREASRLSLPAYFAAIALIAAAAFLVVLLASRWGISTSSDSARYIRSARHVLGLEARIDSPIEAPAEQAHYPPMYSTVLAAAAWIGRCDPLAAARWLHAGLLAANAVIAAELVRRFTGSASAALFTAAAAAFSHASVYIHAIALSEPLFVFFSLLSTGLLVSHLKTPRWTLLIAAALLAGAGVLTRYAGWAMLPSGVVCLLALPARPMRRRLLEATAFAAVVFALPFAWSVRNAIVLGSATNRVIAWHPIGVIHLRDTARTAWNWLAAEDVRHPLLTGASALFAAAVMLLPVVRNRLGRTLPSAMMIFSLAFAGLLVVSISLVDFHTPVDRRILSPVYAAWLVTAGCLLAEANTRSIALRATTWTLALLLALWSFDRSRVLVAEYHRDGAGFAHRVWRDSKAVAFVRESVPPDKWVYTNAPGAVYLLTGRPVIVTVPSKFSASSMQDNPNYPEQFAHMRDDLHSGRAVLVYFQRYARSRKYYPTEDELRRGLGLHPLLRRGGEAVYDYVVPATTAATTQPLKKPQMNAE